ncbi:MAG: lipocalin family protein [Candidatus Melainabacteria bacterium]
MAILMNRVFLSLAGLFAALMLMLFSILTVFSEPVTTPQQSAEPAPLQTVDQVDLKRYMGTWYEIASMPMFFQRRCVGNTRAEYTLLDSGEVKVLNSCETRLGTRQSAEGRAKPVVGSHYARLKVTFLNFFGWRYFAGGDYWVIDLAGDYRYAVVGHPNREYGWILSRTPAMAPADLKTVTDRLKAQGYDLCAFNVTPQNGGSKQSRRLCDVVAD